MEAFLQLAFIFGFPMSHTSIFSSREYLFLLNSNHDKQSEKLKSLHFNSYIVIANIKTAVANLVKLTFQTVRREPFSSNIIIYPHSTER